MSQKQTLPHPLTTPPAQQPLVVGANPPYALPSKFWGRVRYRVAAVVHGRVKALLFIGVGVVVVLGVGGGVLFTINPSKTKPLAETTVTPRVHEPQAMIDTDNDGTPDAPAPHQNKSQTKPGDKKTTNGQGDTTAPPVGSTNPGNGGGGTGGGGGDDGGTTDPPPNDGGGGGGCTTTTPIGASTRTITVNGVQRTYLIVLPSGFNTAASAPVIMGFHGGSSTSDYARQTYGLEGSQQVIYVYPQAPYWAEAGGVGWNVNPAGVDFPYFDTMLADIKSRNCVDGGRVFAAGKSNGGFFVNALGCHRSGSVKAVASVAGGGPQNGCTAAKPAMIVHGTADPTVPISAGRYSRDYWLTTNNYAGAAAVGYNPSPCVSYPGTQNPVIWCEHGGAHDWPSWAGAGIRNFFLSL